MSCGVAPAGAVWYVAYGSNMCADRLACYLTGGTPVGGMRGTPGARLGIAPTEDRRVELRHPLLFGGPSTVWDGGPAYLDVARPGRTVGRGWRVTHDQLEDVVAQENQREPGSVRLAPAVVRDGGVVLDDRYGRLVPLDRIDGEPAVTFTYVRRPPERSPDPAYVEVIEAGLVELGLGESEVASVIASQPQLADGR